ncbi:hypothetical protein PUN28_008197 [Cardiocondyla obscurior]|uniref:Uncharacterized protein n=1 Tax=Cardiocondyla obscurior TaxID=286306 RepID=A0AAW2G1I3_9HYME
MADQDILDIFGDSMSDLSDEEPNPQQEAEPPDPRRGVPKIGSVVQRGDQAQVRHTQWLSEPPPTSKPRRRQVAELTARRRTYDTLAAATEALDARASGRPPPSPRAPPAPPQHRPGWQQILRPILPPPFRPPLPPPMQRPWGPPPVQTARPWVPPPLRPRLVKLPPSLWPTPEVTNCGAMMLRDPPGADNPFIKLRMPTGKTINVPVSAVWKNRKYRARTTSARWLLRFDADGTLCTCRRMEDAP